MSDQALRVTQTGDPRRQFLAAKDTYATVLFAIFWDAYGGQETGEDSCLNWAPDTIRQELEEDFHVKLPAINLHKLMVAIQLVTTDAFFKSLPDFVTFCNVLSGDTFDPNLWDPADIWDISWGMTEGLLISPPEGDDPFTDEILAYIGRTVDDEGIISPPDVLRVALRETDYANQVRDDYSDDPDMFQAITEVEHGRTDQISKHLREGLQELFDQLARLQGALKHGQPERVATQFNI